MFLTERTAVVWQVGDGYLYEDSIAALSCANLDSAGDSERILRESCEVSAGLVVAGGGRRVTGGGERKGDGEDGRGGGEELHGDDACRGWRYDQGWLRGERVCMSEFEKIVGRRSKGWSKDAGWNVVVWFFA